MEQNCICQNKTKHRTEEEKTALLHRLSRMEGQIRGIRRMVEEDAYCVDVLTQSAAVTAAMNAFSREVLDCHIRTCVTDGIRSGDDTVTAELMEILRKMMR